MAITSSAKKAIRSSARKRAFNVRRKRAIEAAVRKARQSISEGNSKAAAQALSEAYRAFDKAAKTGLLKKNAASRMKSRLAASLNRADQKEKKK